MSKIKPIVLKAQTTDTVGVVRLSPEAEKVVRRLHSRSGLPIKTIVSEIITQSEHLIDIDLSGLEEEDEL
jgi:hypothetical protein